MVDIYFEGGPADGMQSMEMVAWYYNLWFVPAGEYHWIGMAFNQDGDIAAGLMRWLPRNPS